MPNAYPPEHSVPMWFAKFSRVRALLKERSSDPWLQGRAAQVAGTALLADGLVGLENPLDGKKKRVGILGAAAIFATGLVFFLLGGWLVTTSSPYTDGLTTQGTVTAVESSVQRDSNGEHVTCTVTVAYEVGGRPYQVTPSMGSDSYCNLQGRQVPVSYRPAKPADGRAILPGVGFLKIFKYVGLVVLVVGSMKLLTRLAECIVGAYLFFWGKKQVRQHPTGDDRALLADLKRAWTGDESISLEPRGSGSLADLFSTATGGEPHAQAQPQRPAQGPPPAWYEDPRNPAQLRWWDGTAWSDIVQPKP